MGNRQVELVCMGINCPKDISELQEIMARTVANIIAIELEKNKLPKEKKKEIIKGIINEVKGG